MQSESSYPEAADTVILVNSGTPDSPGRRSVRDFLRRLLSDRRVVELPRWFWLPLLHLVILPLRVPRVGKVYRRLWQPQGFPLSVITQQQVAAVQQLLDQSGLPRPWRVHGAMQYSSPRLQPLLEQLHAQGVRRLVLLPLFPQYSATVTGGIYDAVADLYRRSRDIPEVRIIREYYRHPAYQQLLKQHIERFWQTHGRPDKLLLSFHSIPRGYVQRGDPYYRQCVETAEQLAAALGLSPDQWQLAFQSRFLGGRWLGPATSSVLREWAQQKAGYVQVFCPGFAADCLETLVEIDDEYRELFVASGGERFDFIPCLNALPMHTEMMRQLLLPTLRELQ